MRYKLVINAFEGDGGASAAPAVAGDAGQVTTAEESPKETTETSDRKPFEEVFKEYGKEASDYFQKRWNERHRDYMTVKDQAKSQGEIIERLALKYGVEDASDLKAIRNAMDGDDDLVMQRAMDNGITVDQQRRMDTIELENKRYREAQQEAERQRIAQTRVNQWSQEANNLKAIFPSFDFEAELSNPEFANALRSGMSVERAYYSLHGPEIVSGAMEYTAQSVRNATEAEQRTRQARPKENGLSRQAAAKVSTDVHNMTKAERAEMARRSMREAIRF